MKFKLSILLIVFFFYSVARAQSVPIDTLHKYGIYDLDRLSPEFHKSRRDELRSKMALHSAALFFAAQEKNRANDVNYLYHQDPNFYYLTGHNEPHSILLLTKDPIVVNGIQTNEVLFVMKRNPSQEVWTGIRLGVEGAQSVLRFSSVLPNDSIEHFLKPILPTLDTIYIQPPPKKKYDPNNDPWVLSSNISTEFSKIFEEKYPKLAIANLTVPLAEMREIKQDEELRLMRKAITISNEAHNEIMRQVKPGWHEYEMQALGEYIFTKNGAEYTGYPCIVGSGNNSTILHYETNRRKTEPGDFVEMDIGAEYHGYSADVTRSFPINGKFSPEQRAIYDLVLEAQDSGIAKAVVGNSFKDPHLAAVSVIKRGLLKLGIIENGDDYRKYFMHGTSHFLGLDVHDLGNPVTPLKEHEIITVEPGIYIAEGSPCDKKWWKIGCRIEDDILITKDGPEILSKASPRRAEDIEKLMHEEK